MVSVFQTTGMMAAEILFRRLFESNLHIPVETALSSSAVQVDVATRKIYFIRHGEYDWHNPQSKDLTEIGVQQAEWTAKRLANLSARKIYSSDLPRALQTAEIIRGAIGNVEYEIDAGLRECLLPMPSLSNVPLEVQKAGEQHATAAFAKYMRPAEQKRGDRNCRFARQSHPVSHCTSPRPGRSLDTISHAELWHQRGARGIGWDLGCFL